MLKLEISTQFKKDLKRINKQGKDKSKLEYVINTLQKEGILPKQYRDHKLIGNLKEYRELHIEHDWLLIYKICKENNKLLRLSRTGSHAELLDI